MVPDFIMTVINPPIYSTKEVIKCLNIITRQNVSDNLLDNLPEVEKTEKEPPPRIGLKGPKGP